MGGDEVIGDCVDVDDGVGFSSEKDAKKEKACEHVRVVCTSLRYSRIQLESIPKRSRRTPANLPRTRESAGLSLTEI